MHGVDRSYPCLTTYNLNLHKFTAAWIGNWTRFQLAHIQVDSPSTRTPHCSLVANAGGRPFCHELGIGWVHIGQWIFSTPAISHWLFWPKIPLSSHWFYNVKTQKTQFLQNSQWEMAEIENIHCPICTQPIPSSWQNGLPPALATDERRGATTFCLEKINKEVHKNSYN